MAQKRFYQQSSYVYPWNPAGSLSSVDKAITSRYDYFFYIFNLLSNSVWLLPTQLIVTQQECSYLNTYPRRQ